MKTKLTLIAKSKLILTKAIGKFVPSCDQITLLVSASMEEELPLRSKLRVAIHLFMCKWCRRFKQQLQLIRTLAHQTQTKPDSLALDSQAFLSDAARERIDRAISDASK
jgi:hypothetical protein